MSARPIITEPPTPVERWRRQRRRGFCALLVAAAFVAALAVYWGVFAEVPVEYREAEQHFKYGSIGSDSDSGIPHRVWTVLPEMFPQHLPDSETFLALPADERTSQAGYSQFGFLFEEGMDRPIGFSRRRVLIDRVGLNCAVCHVGTVRVTKEMDPSRLYDSEPSYASGAKDRVLIPGMPAITVDLQSYARFLHRCAEDGRVTADNVLAFIEARTRLGPLERFALRQAVPAVREALLRQRDALKWMGGVPSWGPGRVDTFNPYKTQILGGHWDGTIGTADLPSLWNQRPREGMQLHWDGNNASVFERNISAALGAGATPTSLDMPGMMRGPDWIGSPDPKRPGTEAERRAALDDPVPRSGELPIPRYPFAIDTALAQRGAGFYRRDCASCHDWKGKYVGQVEPLEKVGTDPHRLRSHTALFSMQQNTLAADRWWRFAHFRRSNGYANMPLDGLWARAPYLHNGAVPTLADLLAAPADRPKEFYRGDDEYDPVKVGFRSDRPRSADGRKLFLLRTSEGGNDRGGHDYGTGLKPEEKQALLEYLKTL